MSLDGLFHSLQHAVPQHSPLAKINIWTFPASFPLPSSSSTPLPTHPNSGALAAKIASPFPILLQFPPTASTCQPRDPRRTEGPSRSSFRRPIPSTPRQEPAITKAPSRLLSLLTTPSLPSFRQKSSTLSTDKSLRHPAGIADANSTRHTKTSHDACSQVPPCPCGDWRQRRVGFVSPSRFPC